MHPSQHYFFDQLARIVGISNLLQDEPAKAYGHDRCDFYTATNPCVVFPQNTEQVRDIVLLANQHHLALVPSGGRTGLSGGAAATQQEIVIAMDKMNAIEALNPIENTVICGAGTITQKLQEFASQHDLLYPMHFASAGSSQIGGNISTNAGGIHVIRYGMTRDWVLGLTVVTGRGDILHLNHGLQKNNTGYDLRHLFIGSEGTLGIITQACIKLTAPNKHLKVLLFAVADMQAIMHLFRHFNSKLSLNAFEFFSDNALHKVTQATGIASPFRQSHAYYVLLEVDCDNRELADQVLLLSEQCLEKQWASDCVISQNQQQAKTLWRLREDISMTLAKWHPYKNDISVTVAKVPDFLQAVSIVIKQDYPDFEVVWYGHIGDGNLHLNILKPEKISMATFQQHCQQLSKQVMEVVKQFSGSISAEHGVGLLKKDFLRYSRSPEEIDYMRQIKQVFDPQGIMNPGKLL